MGSSITVREQSEIDDCLITSCRVPWVRLEPGYLVNNYVPTTNRSKLYTVYSTVLYCLQHSTILYYTVLNYTILYYTFYSTVMYCQLLINTKKIKNKNLVL